MEEYITTFKRSVLRTEWLDDKFLKVCFISGIEEVIQEKVEMSPNSCLTLVVTII
jgi:hypothetical protein